LKLQREKSTQLHYPWKANSCAKERKDAKQQKQPEDEEQKLDLALGPLTLGQQAMSRAISMNVPRLGGVQLTFPVLDRPQECFGRK